MEIINESSYNLIIPSSVRASREESLSNILKQTSDTYSFLSLLGDKKFFLNEEMSSFIMYGEYGKYWIALGDPIGDRSNSEELIKAFQKKAGEHKKKIAFYQADESNLKLYQGFGFHILKIGEEAIVDLENFALAGQQFKNLRKSYNKLSKSHYQFQIFSTDEIFPKIKEVSDLWMNKHKTKEKTFSLGHFCRYYLNHFPIAVIHKAGRIEAFANLWLTKNKTEMAVDLMRQRPDSPHGMMDYLLLNVIFWGQAQKFKTFNLGHAPLTGIDMKPLQTLVLSKGKDLYNFEGLRLYKEKFRPHWRAKYLVSPSALSSPFVLTNIAALVGGSFMGVIKK